MKKFKEVKTYQQDHLSFKKGDVVTSFYDTNGNFILQTISKNIEVKYDMDKNPLLVLIDDGADVIMLSYNNSKTSTINILKKSDFNSILNIEYNNDKISSIINKVYNKGETYKVIHTFKTLDSGYVYEEKKFPNTKYCFLYDKENNLVKLEDERTITTYVYENNLPIKRRIQDKYTNRSIESSIKYTDNYKYAIDENYKYELNENKDMIYMSNKETGRIIWTCEYEYYEE